MEGQMWWRRDLLGTTSSQKCEYTQGKQSLPYLLICVPPCGLCGVWWLSVDSFSAIRSIIVHVKSKTTSYWGGLHCICLPGPVTKIA